MRKQVGGLLQDLKDGGVQIKNLSGTGNTCLKILHVVHGLPRGGLENGVVNLINRLPHPDFEQAVCCLDKRGEMVDRIERNVPIHVLNRRRHDLSVPIKLARIIADWQPDVVHCRNWNTWPDTVPAFWLAPSRRSLVWSFHGFANGYSFPRRRRLISRLLARGTNRMFGVCRDSARRYADVTGIPVNRFDVVYNGVDCERFQPAVDRVSLRHSLGFHDDELVVLTVASLTPVKDHAGLLEAAAQLVAKAGRPLRFLFLGEGALRPQLEEQARRLGITNQVQMPGGSDRVPEYLAAGDLFVLPSKLEGMSNAILEALASGLPVVANAVGGNPELVVDGRCGLLSQQGNVESMVSAMELLVTDDALRRQMGRAARSRAEQVFSIDAMMMAYAEYYRNCVET